MNSQAEAKPNKAPHPGFAAMLCLYKNNVASEVRQALDSAFEQQTLPPAELIVVFDGPIPADVQAVVDDFEKHIPTRRIVFEQNRGLGPASAAAVLSCDYPWLAIIDADDISLPQRFESLSKIAAAHPDTAVVGGAFTEFHMEQGRQITGATVSFPSDPDEIRRYTQSRCPVGHPTAMIRVAAIREVGNYQAWLFNEDYYLWIRLVKAGYEIRNHPDTVLLMRTSPDLYSRRGGIKYWWSEVSLQYFSLSQGVTTLPKFIMGAAIRLVVQVLLPNKMRAGFYKHFLRRT